MNKKNKNQGNIRKQPRQRTAADLFRLFVIYWLIIFMLVVMALFSVGRWLPGWAHWLLYVASLALAGIATYAHVRRGKNSKFDTEKIDDIADELK